ncbi:hypothetical protein J2R99_002844 [Rhodopseudomonas julia]|uniref:Uncharacterized protein n=1 Tax=Rhodopseudomonas julia TaxID=200617 RepID=A0ABU0CBI7_9BRAD|nr:hypothetical protein [Rhodopseudomonas julia]
MPTAQFRRTRDGVMLRFEVTGDNLRYGDKMCRAPGRAGDKFLRVSPFDVPGEDDVSSITLLSAASSTDLSATVEDDPGALVCEGTVLVVSLRPEPEPGAFLLSWHPAHSPRLPRFPTWGKQVADAPTEKRKTEIVRESRRELFSPMNVSPLGRPPHGALQPGGRRHTLRFWQQAPACDSILFHTSRESR